MSQNLPDIGAKLTLDIRPFSESIKAMLKIAEMGSKNLNDIFKLKPPTFSVSKIDAEIKKLDSTLDKYQNEVKQTEASQDKLAASFNRSAASTSGFQGKLLNFTLVLGFVRQGLNYIERGLDVVTSAYNRQEVAAAKLTRGLENIGEGADTYRKLVQQASDLQLKTPFSDESVMDAQATLTTFQKTGDEIQVLIPRILDLAAARMQDGEQQVNLSDVARVLGKVNEENLSVLRRYGIVISETDEKMLKSLTGIKQAEYLGSLLDKRVKGMSETLGSTFSGKWQIFKNQIGEVFEKIGGFVAGAGSSFMKFFMDLLPVIQEAADKIIIFYQETLQMISAAAGGQQAADDFKKSLIELVREGVEFFLSKMRELQPFIVDLITSIRNFISQNPVFIDQLLKIGKALYEISFWIAKIEIGVLSFLVDVMSGLVREVDAALKMLRDFASSPIGKIIFYGSPVGALIDGLMGANDAVTPNINGAVNENLYPNPPAPPVKNNTYKVNSSPGSGNSGKQSDSEKEKNALDQLLRSIREEIKNYEYKNKLTKEFLQEKLAQIEIDKLSLNGIEEENKVYALRKEIFKQLFDMTKMTIPDSKLIIDVDISEDMKKHLEWFKKYMQELEDAAKKEAERIAKMYGNINSILSGSLSIVDALANKLAGGGKTFLNYVSMALKLAQQAISLAQKGSSEDGLGIGDILGFIGGAAMLFLNDGGVVPGTGNTDTVPAMLTPGEGIIRAPRMRELASMFGGGFFSWLNGGGSLSAIAGRFNSGGTVQSALASASDSGIYLNGKLLDGKMKQKIVKEGLYLESLSIGRKSLG